MGIVSTVFIPGRSACSSLIPSGSWCSTPTGPLAEQTRCKVYDMMIANKMLIQGHHFIWPTLISLKNSALSQLYAYSARGAAPYWLVVHTFTLLACLAATDRATLAVLTGLHGVCALLLAPFCQPLRPSASRSPTFAHWRRSE